MDDLNALLFSVEYRELDEYAQLKHLKTYGGQILAMDVRRQLNQLIYNKKLESYEKRYACFNDDLKELQACFDAKAYKATLILAGSILEGFLLDWLSENDGKNYFEKPYQIQLLGDDGILHWENAEKLNVFIDRVADIAGPDWEDARRKAHFIREKRNCVHAKICIRKDLGVNAETCSLVIRYLNDIILSRLQEQKENLEIQQLNLE